MGTETGIEWCHHTDNIVRGCTKISAGCKFCYAEALAKVNPSVLGVWGPNGTRPMTPREAWLDKIARLDRAAEKAGEVRRVFVNSMWDPGEGGPLPDGGEGTTGPRDGHWEALAVIVAAARRFANLRLLMLTKRPANLVQWWGASRDWDKGPWPERLWVGVSVEDQAAADARIPHLLKLPARVRFLSCEPLLGVVDLSAWMSAANPGHRWDCLCRDIDPSDVPCLACASGGGLSWVIVGGESGRHARPMHPDWARSLRDQCTAAGVAFFMKQMDAHAGADKTAIPADLMIRELPDAR